MLVSGRRNAVASPSLVGAEDCSIDSAAAMASSQAAGSPRTTTSRSDGATAASMARSASCSCARFAGRGHDARGFRDAVPRAELGAELHQRHRILVQIREHPELGGGRHPDAPSSKPRHPRGRAHDGVDVEPRGEPGEHAGHHVRPRRRADARARRSAPRARSEASRSPSSASRRPITSALKCPCAARRRQCAAIGVVRRLPPGSRPRICAGSPPDQRGRRRAHRAPRASRRERRRRPGVRPSPQPIKRSTRCAAAPRVEGAACLAEPGQHGAPLAIDDARMRPAAWTRARRPRSAGWPPDCGRRKRARGAGRAPDRGVRETQRHARRSRDPVPATQVRSPGRKRARRSVGAAVPSRSVVGPSAQIVGDERQQRIAARNVARACEYAVHGGVEIRGRYEIADALHRER